MAADDPIRAFERLGASELISIIHPRNERSHRVAARLGMSQRESVHFAPLDLEVDVWHVLAPGRR